MLVESCGHHVVLFLVDHVTEGNTHKPLTSHPPLLFLFTHAYNSQTSMCARAQPGSPSSDSSPSAMTCVGPLMP